MDTKTISARLHASLKPVTALDAVQQKQLAKIIAPLTAVVKNNDVSSTDTSKLRDMVSDVVFNFEKIPLPKTTPATEPENQIKLMVDERPKKPLIITKVLNTPIPGRLVPDLLAAGFVLKPIAMQHHHNIKWAATEHSLKLIIEPNSSVDSAIRTMLKNNNIEMLKFQDGYCVYTQDNLVVFNHRFSLQELSGMWQIVTGFE